MSASATVQDFRLLLRFQELREQLLSDPDDRLNRPLAHWALGNDRRLPVVLMGRVTREIVETPFDELQATPGIGRKKLATLMALLERAVQSETLSAAVRDEEAQHGSAVSNGAAVNGRATRKLVDPGDVSQLTWERWQDVVRRHGLENEPLGRFADSLRDLPTVIWDTPLGEYLGFSLTDLGNLKTHGEKRIRAVIGVFHAVNQVLGESTVESHLFVSLRPRFAAAVEAWLGEKLRRPEFPSRRELTDALVRRLLDQVRIDLGDEPVNLAEGKLGLNGTKRPVRQAAAERGLTRARIYQLLNEIVNVMRVRWPEGQTLFDALRAHYEHAAGQLPQRRWVFDALELFYPQRRKN